MGAHKSRAVSGPGVHECRAGHRIMANTMKVRKRKHQTKHRKRRGHDKAAMNVPGTIAGGLARVCEGSEERSTLEGCTDSGRNTSKRSKLPQPEAIRPRDRQEVTRMGRPKASSPSLITTA